MATEPTAQRSESSGHVALIAVQLCFGLFPLFGKWAFEGFEPRAVAAWRMVVGAMVFAAAALAIYGRRAMPARGDLLRLLICSLLGVALNQVLYLEGLERSTSTNSGLLMLLIPVFTFMLAVGVGQEKFSAPRALGIFVAGAGTTWLLLQREPDLSRPHLIGNLLIAANTLCYSAYLVISRPLARRYPPLIVIAWVYVLSAWTTPLFAWETDIAPAAADTRAWIALALIVIFPTVLGYLLNVYALSVVAASTTAVYVFVQPLIAGSAGFLLLNEPMRTGTVMAAAAIFAGIWLVIRRPSR